MPDPGKRRSPAAVNATTNFFLDTALLVRKGKYFRFMDEKAVKSIFRSSTAGRHLVKSLGGADKAGHSAEMFFKKMDRNKIKIVKETGEVFFMGAGIGLGVAAVFLATGPGEIIGASIGLGIAIVAVPAYAVFKVIKQVWKRLKRGLFTHKKANRWLANTSHIDRVEKGMENPATVSSAIDKFCHKHLSTLSDDWEDVRFRYTMSKNIEKIINVTLMRRPGEVFTFSTTASCGDFTVAFQQMLIFNSAYVKYADSLDLFDSAFVAVDKFLVSSKMNFPVVRMKLMSEVKKWFKKDQVGEALIPGGGINRDYHYTTCINNKKLKSHHRICYLESGIGKAHFDIDAVTELKGENSPKSPSSIARYKKLYAEHPVLQVLEDASHSKFYRPRYRKSDPMNLFRVNNLPDEVMGNESARLLGYLDVLDFCTRDETSSANIQWEYKKFLDDLRTPLANSIANAMRNVVTNSISEGVPLLAGLFSVDEIDASLKDAFESFLTERLSFKDGDPIDFGLDLVNVVTGVVASVATDVFADLAKESWKWNWEMLGEGMANWGTGGIFGLVKDCLEVSVSGMVTGISGLVLAGLKIGFTGIAIPVATAINKKKNLKRYLETEDLSLTKKRGDGGRTSKTRLERLSILRAMLKTNAVMDDWNKQYKKLVEETEKLNKFASTFKVRNCYDAFYAVRKLLIMRERYCSMMSAHNIVREYHLGIIVKFRKMALKNAARAHRLYDNCATYMEHSIDCTCAADMCYHPKGTDTKNNIFGKPQKPPITDRIDMHGKKKVFQDLIFFNDKEVDALLAQFRKISEGEDDTYRKMWDKHAHALTGIKAMQQATPMSRSAHELMRERLAKRRQDMHLDDD